MPLPCVREEYQIPIGKAVKRIREALGWTNKRLSQETGIDISSVVMFEKGKRHYPVKAIELIREATGIDPYVMAYDLYCDTKNESEEVRIARQGAAAAREHQLELMRMHRQRLPGDWYD
jgi:transcriptional regulator with XRE-family HTH domain